MNKIAVLCLCALLPCLNLSAQEFFQLGVVNQQELKLKQCEFDKDAEAVMLLHEASSTYGDQHQLITSHHVKIKILKEKGISAADVSIPYYRKDEFELIYGVEGLTMNATGDGNVVTTKLEKKNIYNKAINERVGEVIFTFPAAKVGSIIEYNYKSVMKHYGGLEDWNFQERFPVVKSKYTLMIVPNAEFAYQVVKNDAIPIVVKPLDGGIYFEMSNIAGLGNEPYMDARKDYLQKVIFQLSGIRQNNYKQNYMTSWDEVTKELMTSSEFSGQLNKKIAGTEQFINETKSLSSPEAKMKAVYQYVRSNVSWNQLYSKYSVDGVKSAWQKKSGSSGDINLLLINLLKEVELDAHPMLVSERFHGKVDLKYPFIDQFNSVFACVFINDKKYYLDATDKSTPPHLIPNSILNTTAFIVNRKKGGPVSITNDALQFNELVLVTLDVAPDGTLGGNVTVNSSDYARIDKLDAYKSDKEKFLRNYFTVDGTTISGTDLELANENNDSMPLQQQCKIKGTLNTTGDYHMLPLNLFTGFDHNPFVNDNRFSNINFGYKRSVTLHLHVKLPDNYVVDEAPKSIKLVSPDQDIRYVRQLEYNKAGNYVSCKMQFAFDKSLYEVDMYPLVQELYKKMFEYLKEPLVLKTKG